MEQKHILVVDDDTAFRTMIRKTLETAGYRVSEAKNALGACEIDGYDLVLLDIQMPGIDGHRILSSLKQDKSCTAPILVITGLSNPDHRTRAIAEGADGFLAKPFNTEVLLSTVTGLLASATSQ